MNQATEKKMKRKNIYQMGYKEETMKKEKEMVEEEEHKKEKRTFSGHEQWN